jgi:hypothetical protein
MFMHVDVFFFLAYSSELDPADLADLYKVAT